MNSTSLPLPGPLRDIQSTFGVLYISTLVCIGLIGITTLQAWFYFLSHHGDTVTTKLTVAVVWCAEFIRCVFLAHASYYYVISGWGNPEALASPTWSIANLPLMTNIGEVIVQLYFAQRVWILSQKTAFRWITLLIVFLAVSTFGMGIAVYKIGLNSSSWTNYVDGAQKTLAPATLAVSMCTNLTIMISLIFLFRRINPQMPKTNHIVNALMFYTIQAGALIVVVEAVVITLDTYINRVGFAYIGVYAMQGNLYANSLLASLNGRTRLRAATGSSVFMQPQSASLRATTNVNRYFRRSASTLDISKDSCTIQRPEESYQLSPLPLSNSVPGPQIVGIKYHDG